jgi:hypothetical protein
VQSTHSVLDAETVNASAIGMLSGCEGAATPSEAWPSDSLPFVCHTVHSGATASPKSTVPPTT